MKVVVNRCYGAYSLSEAAYAELGLPWDGYGFAFCDDRTNPALVAVVEKLGQAASGKLSDLEVIEVPDDLAYDIEDYDGIETIHETHRSWP